MAGLGIALYAAIAVIAEREGAQWLISLALAAPLGALLGFVAMEALRTGLVPAMGGAVTRSRHPITFWCLAITHVAASLLLGALAAWSAYRLAAAW
ncbi:hypothetical protein KTR66_15100 [Roseococcus sp. SDR]|uniref:hypothetical protein n=1 Tax=Roseococcus sp. SDR TaxID=2835532 RepID=UPI001BD04943|nr:hypothetical protein [Roseococcus sp. SDR]MBS7791329.1 hypothetical protein [Roseococcus sp. SDR]MBV1846643.1 hypothetical protein [Roseococcus sp. SDR]